MDLFNKNAGNTIIDQMFYSRLSGFIKDILQLLNIMDSVTRVLDTGMS